MNPANIPVYFSQHYFDNPIRMPTVAEVNAFAERIGVRFPREYTAFITKNAGHIVTYDVGIPSSEVTLVGQYHYFLRELGFFFHYDDSRDNDYSVQFRYDWYQEVMGASYLVPISKTNVEGDIAFDFTESLKEPRIVLTNVYNWVPDNENLELTPVAGSFSELLDSLITRERFEAKYASD